MRFRSPRLLASLPLLALAAAAPAQDYIAAGHRVGQAVVFPDLPLKNNPEPSYGLLAGPPTSRIVEPGVLEVAFETQEPTGIAAYSWGVNTLDEELDYPRFRWDGREEGDAPKTSHAFQIKFADTLKGSLPNTPYEPRVCWRAEVFFPKTGGTRFLEGRAYFDPETFGDAANILFGPYVEQATETTAVLYWETDRPTDARVFVDGVEMPDVGSEAADATKHEVLVAGLRPGRRYRYAVKSGATRTREYEFKTAGGDRFEFATMVDSREGVGGGYQNFYGVAGFSLYNLLNDAYHRGADLIFFPGDLINGYTNQAQDFRGMLNSFRQITGPVGARVPIYEGFGNHETLLDSYDDGSRFGISFDKQSPNSAEDIFAEAFCNPKNGPAPELPTAPPYSENVYWFDHGQARFFMLNNNYWWTSRPHEWGGNLEGYVLPKQMEWLREQVAAADADPNVKLLFFGAQEPPFPNGGHTKDAMWWGTRKDRAVGGDTNGDGKVDADDAPIIECRNTMWEIIASSPKSVAFITGDEHAYSRLIVNGDTNVGHKKKLDGAEAEFRHPIWQVTSGGAGAPWYDKELNLPWSPWLKAHSTQPHYAYFRVDGENVTLEAYSQTGQRIDAHPLRVDGENTAE